MNNNVFKTTTIKNKNNLYRPVINYNTQTHTHTHKDVFTNLFLVNLKSFTMVQNQIKESKRT